MAFSSLIMGGLPQQYIKVQNDIQLTIINLQISTGKTEATPAYAKGNYKDRNAKERFRKSKYDTNRVYMEQWEWYDKCFKRERNAGIQI